MASIVKTEMKGTTFAGAHLVPDAPPGSPAFACDPGTPSCYGYTGEQVQRTVRWDILREQPAGLGNRGLKVAGRRELGTGFKSVSDVQGPT
jgi:hypothetical protein